MMVPYVRYVFWRTIQNLVGYVEWVFAEAELWLEEQTLQAGKYVSDEFQERVW